MDEERREPPYWCVESKALRFTKFLSSDGEKAGFLDGLREMTECIMNDRDFPCFPDDMCGELLRDAGETMSERYTGYMKQVSGNPKGTPKGGPKGDPKGTPKGGPKGTPKGTNLNQSNLNQYNLNQINQIKDQLMTEGYAGTEIDEVIERIPDQAQIRNPIAYIRAAIAERRKEKPIVSAQDYNQRDYSGKRDEVVQRFIECVEQMECEEPQEQKGSEESDERKEERHSRRKRTC